MKKLLTLLFALITLFSFGQDAAPDTLAVRLNSPSFYYSPGDSSLRMYKCYVYGWTKLAPQRNVDNLAAWAGTVKSVGITVPTGLSVTGSPVTVSGTIGIGLASGYSIPSTRLIGQARSQQLQPEARCNSGGAIKLGRHLIPQMLDYQTLVIMRSGIQGITLLHWSVMVLRIRLGPVWAT